MAQTLMGFAEPFSALAEAEVADPAADPDPDPKLVPVATLAAGVLLDEHALSSPMVRTNAATMNWFRL
jgi:hypothetical protein